MIEFTESRPLVITKMSARNVLKFEDFSVELGKITKFIGANDQGKTSALRLAEIALSGTTNPHVIHNGADKGEVIVEFSDGLQLRRAFTAKGQYPKITDSEGRSLPSPQAYLNDLIGRLQFNPIAWLDLAPKDQVRTLLEAIHVTLTPAEVREAIGFEPPASVDFSRHGLEVASALRDHFAGERRAQNATVDRLKRQAETLRAQLPDAAPTVTDEERKAAEDALAEARNRRDSIAARNLAASQHQQAVARLQSAMNRETEQRERLNDEVRNLEAQIMKIHGEIAASVKRHDGLRAEMSALATSAPPTDEEIAAAGRTQDDAIAAVRSIEVRDRLAKEFERLEALESEIATETVTASVLDDAVKKLTNDLPRQLLAKAQLPVGSLEIEGDRILVDGTDLQYQAQSRQIAISLAIARALNPKLKVICIDGFEALDAERRIAFVDEARNDEYVYLVSQVTEGPLVVEKIEGAA